MEMLSTLILLGCTTLIMLVFMEFRIYTRTRQRALNEAIAHAGLKQDAFCLYLRPLSTAGNIPIRNALRSWLEQGILGTVWDIELSLSIALEDIGILVAIADKYKSAGAAKLIFTDDVWQLKFKELCSKARNIFSVPHNSKSVIWEIKQLIKDEDLLKKTYFLMPPAAAPSLIRYLWRYITASSARRRWFSATRALHKEGIELPEFRSRGLIFQLSPKGNMTRAVPLNNLDEKYVRLLLTNPEFAESYVFNKPWFQKFPARYTIFEPGFLAVVPVYMSIYMSVVILGAFLHNFLFQNVYIVGGSMRPTFLPGVNLFVSKVSYGYSKYSFPRGFNLFDGRILGSEPERGDVVVFKSPRDNSTDSVARLVGLPGDRIQMIGGVLHIDGQPVKRERFADNVEDTKCGPNQAVHQYRETLPNGRSYITQKLSETCSYYGQFHAADDTQVFYVPPHHYFMLGDNRDDTADSRYSEGNGVGYVPAENLAGPARFLFSIDESARWYAPWRWYFEIHWSRIGDVIY